MADIDIERFDPAPDPELLCPICRSVLHKPYETRCQHVFCKDCIFTWVQRGRGSRSNHGNKCPSCRDYVYHDDLKPALTILCNLINKLKVRCINTGAGCKEIIEKEHLAGHEKNCDYSEVTCKNLGCRETILKKDIQKHEEDCPMRMVQCTKDCQLKMPYYRLRRHVCVEELKQELKERFLEVAVLREIIHNNSPNKLPDNLTADINWVSSEVSFNRAMVIANHRAENETLRRIESNIINNLVEGTDPRNLTPNVQARNSDFSDVGDTPNDSIATPVSNHAGDGASSPASSPRSNHSHYSYHSFHSSDSYDVNLDPALDEISIEYDPNDNYIPNESGSDRNSMYSQPDDLDDRNSMYSQPDDLDDRNSMYSQPDDLDDRNSMYSQPDDLDDRNSMYSQPDDLDDANRSDVQIMSGDSDGDQENTDNDDPEPDDEDHSSGNENDDDDDNNHSPDPGNGSSSNSDDSDNGNGPEGDYDDHRNDDGGSYSDNYSPDDYGNSDPENDNSDSNPHVEHNSESSDEENSVGTVPDSCSESGGDRNGSFYTRREPNDDESEDGSPITFHHDISSKSDNDTEKSDTDRSEMNGSGSSSDQDDTVQNIINGADAGESSSVTVKIFPLKKIKREQNISLYSDDSTEYLDKPGTQKAKPSHFAINSDDSDDSEGGCHQSVPSTENTESKFDHEGIMKELDKIFGGKKTCKSSHAHQSLPADVISISDEDDLEENKAYVCDKTHKEASYGKSILCADLQVNLTKTELDSDGDHIVDDKFIGSSFKQSDAIVAENDEDSDSEAAFEPDYTEAETEVGISEEDKVNCENLLQEDSKTVTVLCRTDSSHNVFTDCPLETESLLSVQEEVMSQQLAKDISMVIKKSGGIKRSTSSPCLGVESKKRKVSSNKSS